MLFKIQIDILSISLLVMVILHAFSKLNKRNTIHKLFLTTCILNTVILTLEILSVFLNGSDLMWMNLHFFVITAGFILSPIVPYLTCKFINLWLNKTTIVSLKYTYLLEIPLIINTIITLISLKFNIVFTIDSMNNYIRGGLFSLSFILSVIYSIYSFSLISKNRVKVSSEFFRFLNMILLFPLIMSTIQILLPNFLFIWSSISISLVLIYILLQQELLELDALTGAYNREFFNRNLSKMLFIRNDNFQTGAINIDLNDFKSINDNYGHAEGDIALMNVVKLLQEIFIEDSFIIRLGGDEFMVILNKTNTDHMKTMINIMLERFNNFNNKPSSFYDLNLSYGYGLFDDSYKSIESFLDNIDSLMYKNKLTSKNLIQSKEKNVVILK